MSGYKRVNFYELCRLCATNQQKEKTHIFQEEGRKIQLQNKIQSCLSLTVCENDFLPKVVCSKCLRSLEVCYTFRQECVTSESMLSSYFKNFRYTEDFKKSGKVYIKDTAPKSTAPQVQQSKVGPPPHIVNTTTNSYVNEVKPVENVPSFYTLQLPAIVTNQPIENKQLKSDINHEILHNNQLAYNLNTINLAPIKTIPKVTPSDNSLSNVVVNANGEVINIAQLVDFESIISQANLQKVKITGNKIIKRAKESEEPVIKIDLTNNDVDYDTGQKLQHVKNNNNNQNQNKFAYAIKVDDNKVNPSVIFNSLEFNQGGSFNNFNGNNMYMNAVPNCTENSTVNLNVLNQDTSQSYNRFNVMQPQKVEKVQDPPVKMHMCEICQKSFKRREHLYQHVKLHTGFRPYTCENCNKSFMRKEHLLRHMTSHSGQKNFTCNVCDKSFSRNDNLLKHKKTHEKQASYTCDICQKQFVMKHYYIAHKLTHDNERVGGLVPPPNVWNNVLKT